MNKFIVPTCKYQPQPSQLCSHDFFQNDIAPRSHSALDRGATNSERNLAWLLPFAGQHLARSCATNVQLAFRGLLNVMPALSHILASELEATGSSWCGADKLGGGL
jgi:hypothetical protein